MLILILSSISFTGAYNNIEYQTLTLYINIIIELCVHIPQRHNYVH